MRILVWPADDGGCGHNRLIWPAEALAQQGADVSIDWAGPRTHWARRWSGDEPPDDARVVGVERPDADVVVLQRPARRWWTDLIPHLQRHGVRVVIDVDDDFAHIPAGNIARDSLDPKLHPARNWEWIARACHLADLVTATTPALAARYARHGRVQVLPNLVPASYLDVHAERDGRTCGWTGSIETHPHDLETCGRTVQRALDANGWRFRVVGTGIGVRERLGLSAEPDATGWQPIENYPQLYASLDVAIVPLHRSPFNDAKSALKMGEAAALGVPVVASPTPDNLRLNKAGVGLIAPKPRDWARHLDRLMRSPDLRADIAGRGRDAMRTRTYENRCGQWLIAWETTCQVATGAARARSRNTSDTSPGTFPPALSRNTPLLLEGRGRIQRTDAA